MKKIIGVQSPIYTPSDNSEIYPFPVSPVYQDNHGYNYIRYTKSLLGVLFQTISNSTNSIEIEEEVQNYILQKKKYAKNEDFLETHGFFQEEEMITDKVGYFSLNTFAPVVQENVDLEKTNISGIVFSGKKLSIGTPVYLFENNREDLSFSSEETFSTGLGKISVLSSINQFQSGITLITSMKSYLPLVGEQLRDLNLLENQFKNMDLAYQKIKKFQ